MDTQNNPRPLAILRIVTTIAETSEPYNQYSLPLATTQDITLCSYFKATVTPPPTITFVEGDGTLLGFFRALKTAYGTRTYDVIHVHMVVAGFLFLLANLVFRKARHSTLFTVSNSYQNYKLRNKLMLIPVFAGFQKIVCNSHAVFDSFPGFYKWLARGRICTIQNGVDIDRVNTILGSGGQSEGNKAQFTVISVGRIIKIKNLLTLLAAFRKNASPENRLLFVGAGDLMDMLRAKIKEWGLEKQVELTGLMPRNEVYKALDQADVFVSTSLGEGLPVAALEAMACRCPVILSDIEPHRELATGTDCIPLISTGDVDGFAREISRFQSMSREERKAVGERCRDWVEEHFSLAAMNKKYISLYEQLSGR